MPTLSAVVTENHFEVLSPWSAHSVLYKKLDEDEGEDIHEEKDEHSGECPHGPADHGIESTAVGDEWLVGVLPPVLMVHVVR